MGINRKIRIANDNVPTVLSQKQQVLDSLNTAFTPGAANNYLEKSTTQSLSLGIGFWLMSLVMMVAIFAFGLGTIPKTLSSISLLWLGLWNSYISADHGRWRLSEISVVTAIIGLVGATVTSANVFGFGLTPADGLMLMSILPLLAGYILKSRICVLASICASLTWSALSFAGLVETSYFIMLFPIICATQIFLATRIQSGLAISLAVITTYYWILNFILNKWTLDNLPLTFAATGLFILGVAHHRGGKAAEDKRLIGSSIHIHAGWLAAMIGAIGFQYFWLTPDAVQNSTETLSVNGLNLWKGIVIIALGVVLWSAIIRYKHAQISLSGIFLLTTTSAIIPMMLWFPAWPQNIMKSILRTQSVPTIGVFMGAAIFAAALGMTLNGVRRHSPFMMGMGISVLFIESYVLMKPSLMTIDYIVIFTTSLLGSLAVGAIIAGSSLAHQGTAPRLKYS